MYVMWRQIAAVSCDDPSPLQLILEQCAFKRISPITFNKSRLSVVFSALASINVNVNVNREIFNVAKIA